MLMRRSLLVALVVLVAGAAAAQEQAPAPTGPGSAPTEDPRVRSTLNTVVESAHLGPPGVLGMELAYRAAIDGYPTPWGDRTLHTGILQLAYPVDDRMEFRLGWDMFGVAADDRDNISGVGDPWFEGKFAFRRLPAIDYPHALAIIGSIRPGIGQDPVKVTGVTFAATGVYTIAFDPIDLDVLAGIAINTDDNPSYLSLPLGGRVVWPALDFVDVYGEVTETLHFTRLRSSETQIGAGCAVRPADSLELTVTGGLGLSESVPAGFVQLGIAFVLSKLEA